ncbi:hypothetical protein DPMN_057256 [Dreissena polymorpha]|uniref:Uncharacterized protein n=1 Tax=Dreissena polymorpha TaxID=45954 RepID=A0A9D4HVV3_DREPO|nr:hypothetical protein DPMN_057256 [Dreissena polymorpha]
MGIPKVVLLTKIDLACRKVAAMLKMCLKLEASKRWSRKLPTYSACSLITSIFPVKNYVFEIELNVVISILALLALRQILYLTEDYLEGLQEKLKRVKVSTVNKQSSKKVNGKD